jgi:ketosteroid isomerase-like protein
MSQKNVDAVRAVYAEWATGNFRASEDLYDPLVLFIPIADFPTAGHYLGKQGVRDFMLGFLAAWTNLTIEAEELTEVGDSVLVAARWRGIGKESGARTEKQVFDVWTFRGPLATRVEFFPTRAEALEALGLSEQALTPPAAEPARYCAGDVAGRDRDASSGLRSDQPR